MPRKRTITIAIAFVSSSVALGSSALAGQKVSDRSYWPREVAASTASIGPLSSFAFDSSGPQSAIVAIRGKSNGPYQGGPHPR
jgi:hypothetical protein